MSNIKQYKDIELSGTFFPEFWLISLPGIFPIQLHYFKVNDKYIITINFRHAASPCINDGVFKITLYAGFIGNK